MDHTQLKVGDKVGIQNKTLSGVPCIEGEATIREIQDCDAMRMIAMVEFDKEPGRLYPRFIWSE